jgi:hypothetical protein
MEVTGQFHALAALFMGDEPPICIGEMDFPRAGLKVVEKSFCSCRESNTDYCADKPVD